MSAKIISMHLYVTHECFVVENNNNDTLIQSWNQSYYCIWLFSPLNTFFQGNGLLRALYVAAFAVSGYASSEGRNCKPFNPLLGETFEADYPEKGIRFFSEKVSSLWFTEAEVKDWNMKMLRWHEVEFNFGISWANINKVSYKLNLFALDFYKLKI